MCVALNIFFKLIPFFFIDFISCQWNCYAQKRNIHFILILLRLNAYSIIIFFPLFSPLFVYLILICFTSFWHHHQRFICLILCINQTLMYLLNWNEWILEYIQIRNEYIWSWCNTLNVQINESNYWLRWWQPQIFPYRYGSNDRF